MDSGDQRAKVGIRRRHSGEVATMPVESKVSKPNGISKRNKSRSYRCSRCFKHGVVAILKNHTRVCPYIYCHCDQCAEGSHNSPVSRCSSSPVANSPSPSVASPTPQPEMTSVYQSSVSTSETTTHPNSSNKTAENNSTVNSLDLGSLSIEEIVRLGTLFRAASSLGVIELNPEVQRLLYPYLLSRLLFPQNFVES